MVALGGVGLDYQVLDPFFGGGNRSNFSALRIIGPSKLAILRTQPLLYRFKPFHWRVQDPLG